MLPYSILTRLAFQAVISGLVTSSTGVSSNLIGSDTRVTTTNTSPTTMIDPGPKYDRTRKPTTEFSWSQNNAIGDTDAPTTLNEYVIDAESDYDYRKKLYEELLNPARYNRMHRPVLNKTKPIVIDINISIHQLLSVDGVAQKMVTNCLVILSWYDELLTWDPDENDDIESFVVEFDSIWKPELSMPHSVDEKTALGMGHKVSPTLWYNGHVFWAFSNVFKTSCVLNMEKYPFDIQNCRISISSAAYTVLGLDLTTPSEINTKLFWGSHEWELLGSVAFARHVDAMNITTALATFILRFKRKPAHYVVNILVPNVALSFLNCFVFLVSVDSGEKISYGVAMLLTSTMSFTYTSDKLPRGTDGLPAIVKYFGILLTNSLVAVLLTIVNCLLRRHIHSGERTMTTTHTTQDNDVNTTSLNHSNDVDNRHRHIADGGQQQWHEDRPKPDTNINDKNSNMILSTLRYRGKNPSMAHQADITPSNTSLFYPDILGFFVVMGCWCGATVWYFISVLR